MATSLHLAVLCHDQHGRTVLRRTNNLLAEPCFHGRLPIDLPSSSVKTQNVTLSQACINQFEPLGKPGEVNGPKFPASLNRQILRPTGWNERWVRVWLLHLRSRDVVYSEWVTYRLQHSWPSIHRCSVWTELRYAMGLTVFKNWLTVCMTSDEYACCITSWKRKNSTAFRNYNILTWKFFWQLLVGVFFHGIRIFILNGIFSNLTLM